MISTYFLKCLWYTELIPKETNTKDDQDPKLEKKQTNKINAANQEWQISFPIPTKLELETIKIKFWKR